MQNILVHTLVSVFGILHLFCVYANNFTVVTTISTSKNDDDDDAKGPEKSEVTTLSARDKFYRLLPPSTAKPTTDKLVEISIHKEIGKKCKQLRTHRLKESCKRIAENSFVANMGDNVTAFLNIKEESKFFQSKSSSRRLGLLAPKLPGLQECNINCPSGQAWSGATAESERSFSPWIICEHYDPDRFPQLMPFAKCKCSGCMDPMTGKENINLNSVLVKTIVSVLIKDSDLTSFQNCDDQKCKPRNVELDVGCDCVIPITKN